MVDFIIYSTTIIGLWAVLGLSLNLQFGLTGLVNFGQVLPFAVGAYGAGFAAMHGLPGGRARLAGIVLAPLVGVLVILPARPAGPGLLGADHARRRRDLPPHHDQRAGDRRRHRGRVGPIAWATGPSPCCSPSALLAVACSSSSGSPTGRSGGCWVIREDETLAATLGRNPLRFQMLVTVVAWTLAGAAGVLYAHVTGYVSPASFMVIETFVIWTAVVLGGPGSNLGVVAGTIVVQLTSVSTRFVAQWSHLPSDLVANLRLATFGLVLVLVFLYRPQGLLPERKKAYDVDRR